MRTWKVLCGNPEITDRWVMQSDDGLLLIGEWRSDNGIKKTIRLEVPPDFLLSKTKGGKDEKDSLD